MPNLKPDDGRSKKRPGITSQSQAIMQSALPLLLDFGSNKVSISQICKAADVSRPTFYRCFESKDALLESLYHSSVEEAVALFLLNDIDLTKPTSLWLDDALDRLYDAIFEQAEVATLLFRESNDPNSAAYHIVDRAFDNIIEALTKLKLIPRKSSHKILVKSALVANQWLVHNAIIKGLSKQDRQEAKQAAHILAKKLFN